MTRFYNAGDKLEEYMSYSLPDSMQQDNGKHSLSRWALIAPKQGWFDVPTTLDVNGETVALYFVKDISLKFGKRGIVKLDPQYDATKEDSERSVTEYPVASTEDACIARGAEIWQLYLRSIVENHLRDCQAAMSAGGAPTASSGFTKHAMKLLGIDDPGEKYFNQLKQGGPAGVSADVAAILASQQQQTQAMMTALLAIASGQKLDPEALKAALAPPAMPASMTSGVATGKITKPVTMAPDFPVAKPMTKADRKAAVAQELAKV